MNKKVLKLEFDLDFVLIAITSAQKDYRMCYLINKFLHFNFKRVDDHEVNIYPNSPEPVQFAMFEDFWEASETMFYIIANRSPDGLLIPEMREADYFMLIKNYIDDQDLVNIVNGLNKIPEVVAAIKIDPKKVKSRENLLF
ncbi:IPExxxVDY family protein [Mucilaginibacter myungsuensis]|uniref:IPExxxVDY family protein n=1 Tax=Mucilaginibacter myungsuensis TaxID=649104 RepID=A0A929PVG7_9SPHI|nr:IPExxxVDY family protein [Mucilaginibacter myungsuensis]MBE9661114.1 IPExxxVDY family protein [Mucilaginibacter myungsuensis]MDN3597258.1 IPExxxVDY family protein [Mucilaginibacter myungsuensis]